MFWPFDGNESESYDGAIRMRFSFIFIHFLGNQNKVLSFKFFEFITNWECYCWKLNCMFFNWTAMVLLPIWFTALIFMLELTIFAIWDTIWYKGFSLERRKIYRKAIKGRALRAIRLKAQPLPSYRASLSKTCALLKGYTL